MNHGYSHATVNGSHANAIHWNTHNKWKKKFADMELIFLVMQT